MAGTTSFFKKQMVLLFSFFCYLSFHSSPAVALISPNVPCQNEAFNEFQNPNLSVDEVWGVFLTETNNLERLRLLAGSSYIASTAQLGGLGHEAIEVTEVREALCQIYLKTKQDSPNYYDDYTNNERLRSSLVSKFLQNISINPNDPAFFDQVLSSEFYGWVQVLNFATNDYLPHDVQDHQELSRIFDSLNDRQIRNKQLKTLAQIYAFDPLDTSVTAKLKLRTLQMLKARMDETATQNTTGCVLFQPFLDQIKPYNRFIIADLNPAGLNRHAQALSLLNLSCLDGDFKSPLNFSAQRWTGYLEFLQSNAQLFSHEPEIDAILREFEIPLWYEDDRAIYGSFTEPLTDLDKFYTIIALETWQRMGAYTFPPSRGRMLYLQQTQVEEKNPMDYAVYASPPTNYNWVPNQTDYELEQPGRGHYINYLFAHEAMMAREVQPSRYNLPVPKFLYRVVFITERDFLEELKSQQSGLITNFTGYALPDTHRSDYHAWKFQTIGPTIPGARPGVLSAEDTWRGNCLPNPTSNPYLYVYNETEYCLDVGGIHERGHLAYGMFDLYWYNTTDYFWNHGTTSQLARDRCLLFQSLQNMSPYTRANSVSDQTLSIVSTANKFTLADWEHMYKQSFSSRFHSLLSANVSSNLNLFISQLTESSNSGQTEIDGSEIDSVSLYLLLGEQTQLFSLGTTQAEPGKEAVEIMIPFWQLRRYNYSHLVIVPEFALESDKDMLLLPKYLIEHLAATHERASLSNQDLNLPIDFRTDNRPSILSSSPVMCETSAQINSAQFAYHPNRLAIISGIIENVQPAIDQYRPYVTIRLPLDIHYMFIPHNNQTTHPVFPSVWTGPMPSL